MSTFQEAPNKRLNQGSHVWREWSTQFCNPCSPNDLHRVLHALGAAPRRRWGQNFLIDRAAQRRIVEAAQIQQHESVWEIGPGLGALTQHLWRRCRDLTLFEIDPILIQFYKSRINAPCEDREPCEGRKPSVGQLSQNCRLIEGDVCQTWQTALKAQAEQAKQAQQGGPDAVIGNLPYNSASLLLRQFAMQADFRPRCMVFTVQKEFAERLKAQTGTKAYSSFSVLMQSRFAIEPLFDVGPQLFTPRPHVVSSAVRLQAKTHGLSLCQSRELERFTRAMFAQRRKTIANNLKTSRYREHFAAIQSALAKLGINCSQRAQEVSVEQFLAIGKILDQILGPNFE